MDRRCPGFLLILAIVSLAALSGCVGKSTSNSGSTSVQTVTLNPSGDVSLELGKTQNFSATARNAAGQSVFATIHFVSDNNASLTISNSGVACAGTWDSLSNPVICTPGVTGITTVTAEAEGVSSAPTTVYVHQHIQSMQVTPTDTHDGCFSQGTTWNFQATAFGAQGVDITNSVGPQPGGLHHLPGEIHHAPGPGRFRKLDQHQCRRHKDDSGHGRGYSRRNIDQTTANLKYIQPGDRNRQHVGSCHGTSGGWRSGYFGVLHSSLL